MTVLFCMALEGATGTMTAKIITFDRRTASKASNPALRPETDLLTLIMYDLLKREGYSLDETITLLMPLLFRPGTPNLVDWGKVVKSFFYPDTDVGKKAAIRLGEAVPNE